MGTDATSILSDLRELELELAEMACARRIALMREARAAGVAIGDVGTQAGIVARAGEVLGEHLAVERVLLSAVVAGRAEPRTLWERDHAEARPLEELAVALQYPRIEADVVRRRRAQAVVLAQDGRRAPAAMTEAFGWTAYVVAPVNIADSVVGLLHVEAADANAADELVEPVAHYAVALGEVLAIATMRETLGRHQEDRRIAVRRLSEALGGDDGRPSHAPATDAAGALTPRESEILELLSRGMTNKAIATALLIGEGTVKFHVKNVLRKLGCASRTEAVARYRGKAGTG